MTIDPIVNAMTLAEVVLHILQQGPNKGNSNFETLYQSITNISKDIDVVTKKARMQKRKKLKVKTKKMNARTKTTKKEIVEK